MRAPPKMSSARFTQSSAQQASTWLVRLTASDVGEEIKAEFFAWLGEEEAHQRAYIDAEKLWGRLAIVEKLPVPPASVEDSWLDTRLGWLLRPATAVFASTLLALVTVMFYLQFTGPAQVHYVTAVGERHEFLLEDGSWLHLNTDSAVVISMNRRQRLLELTRGEAYFDVSPDPDRPLVVKTAGGYVRVLGTQFNIRQMAETSILTVVEGKVAVVQDAEVDRIFTPEFEAEVTLVAEQQTRMTPGTALTAPISVDTDLALAWRKGRLIYDGVALAQVIADIDRYFPGTIKLDDPALAELEVVGVLNLQNKAATLRALEVTFNVKAVQLSAQLTVIRRQQQ